MIAKNLFHMSVKQNLHFPIESVAEIIVAFDMGIAGPIPLVFFLGLLFSERNSVFSCITL